MQRATSAFYHVVVKKPSVAQQLIRPFSSVTPMVHSPLCMATIQSNRTLLMKKMALMTTSTTAASQVRNYAKKGGKAAKGGKKNSKDDDDDDDFEDSKGKGGKGKGGSATVAATFDADDMGKKMGQCLEHLKREFTTMRAGTANPAILDPVMVRVEGKMVPLRDLAQVAIKDAKTLMVNVHDPELTSAIEKAIREAGLNLNPIADNKAVRVPVPKPTKEFRESLVKMASTSTEKTKTIIRKMRQDGMKDLKKDLKAGMGEDENYALEKKAQTLHDKYIKDADDALKAKTKEIMAN